MKDVVFTRCPVGNATEMAVKKGWLQAELSRHDARFVLLQSLDKPLHKAHFTQEAPLHFREGGNIPPLWAQSCGDRCVLIGLTLQRDCRGVFVRKDSDIESVDQLAKARLAIPVRKDAPIDFRYLTAVKEFTDILNYAGLSYEATEKYMVPCENITAAKVSGNQLDVHGRTDDLVTEEFEAVLSGRADAAFARNVKALRLEKSGLLRNLLTPELQSEIPYVSNDTVLAITCTKPFAYENPEIVVSYLKTLIFTGRYISGHHDEFVESSSTGIYGATPEEMKAAFDPLVLYERVPCFSEECMSQINEQKEFLNRMGIIRNNYSIESWMDGAFLKAAMEEAEHGSLEP